VNGLLSIFIYLLNPVMYKASGKPTHIKSELWIAWDVMTLEK